MEITRQLKAYYKIFSQHGAGEAKVELDPKEVALLVHIAYYDLNSGTVEDWFNKDIKELLKLSYYDLKYEDIDKINPLSIEDACEYLKESGALDPSNIIYLYLKNLSDLHRRRFKYRYILSKQPFPSAEQIGPRSLIEYGNCNEELLFNWLHWRKWIYDIDNRSAQETGYLFEPILASCIGGESVSHRNSPVKRLTIDGDPTEKGRQIDCYIEEGTNKSAYELKLRVTIAASGQGRFGEEMSFPKEANAAGIKPVLIVFDSTPSELLRKLKKQYEDNNGEVYLGQGAWNLLIKKAGPEMGQFIKKYLKPPLEAIATTEIKIPQNISLRATEEEIKIINDQGDEYFIKRSKKPEVVE
ncbi:restriction endonuclease [Peribacillus saganii]|uniref:Restriction endonuclease n=1 Tax=Peribacillus saganii TaxID=2303992 RepID=A0A372LCK6_9BACI|nr:restriction endonuclease [Peribacillus saganii]RFU63684.1 restriction endonuclease [Peribacillus saganii]